MTSKHHSNNCNSEETPLDILGSLDGYYIFFGQPCRSPSPTAAQPLTSEGTSEEKKFREEVKKTYRRLCLSHHPDKKGGDAKTFQALNRAYKVLSTPKLKRQYDLLGFDLEDDDDHGQSGDSEQVHGENEDSENSANSPMAQIAAMVIATIMQVLIRTATIAVSAVFVPRYTITTIICLGLIWAMWFVNRGNLTSHLPVVFTSISLASMHYSGNGEWFFCLGETFMIAFSFITSVPGEISHTKPYILIATITSSIFSFILKGRFWRYVVLLTFEGVILLLATILMPVLEMIVDELVNAKLSKYGEKIRNHAKNLK
uniref:J domain-containing protein n=1 Tax=Corethron hystrix TaxID=216773 RepID=A0A7S1BCF7_9STRA|mmetsp:Transcript_21861/g.49727  ORF Transcript_21861/g.49727 Transcript_21861/m.49727 type:complete len:315 (+) Transcript_21861:201-1145(+)